MKRIALVLVVVLAALALGGCSLFNGKDGTISGQIDYSSYIYQWNVFSLGGFPNGTISQGTSYTVSPGTYEVQYAVVTYNSGYYWYWPGNTSGTGSTYDSSPYYYWDSTYTVTANKGSLFTNGVSKSFVLYLNYSYGLQVESGDATVSTAGIYANQASSVGSMPDRDIAPTSSSWTSADGSITVSVTNTLKKMTTAEASRLSAQSVAK